MRARTSPCNCACACGAAHASLTRDSRFSSQKNFSRLLQSAVDRSARLAYSPAHTRRNTTASKRTRHGSQDKFAALDKLSALLGQAFGRHEVSVPQNTTEPRGWVVAGRSSSPSTTSRSGQRSTEARVPLRHTPRRSSRPDTPGRRPPVASVIASNRSRKGSASFAPLGRVLFWELFLCARRLTTKTRRHEGRRKNATAD